MAGTVQWTEPPENATVGGARNTKWGHITATLKDNPKRWALVSTKPNKTAAVSLANGVAGGKRAEFEPAGSFESRYAENTTGGFDVWIRFVGEDGASQSEAEGSDSDVDPFDDDE